MKGKSLWTIFGLLVLVASVVSGCVRKQFAVPCGASDYVYLAKGNALSNVHLPTDENKTYTVITPKDGFWMSKECFERIDV